MKIFDQKFANFLHNLKKIYKNIQQNTKKRYPLNFFLEKIYKNNDAEDENNIDDHDNDNA